MVNRQNVNSMLFIAHQCLGVGVCEEGLRSPVRFQRPLIGDHHGRVRGEVPHVDGLRLGSQGGIHLHVKLR